MDRKVVEAYFRDVQTCVEGMATQRLWNQSCKLSCLSPSENVTVLGCANVAGSVMPPTLIVKGKLCKSLPGFCTADAPPYAKFMWQKKAWMEDSLGVECFKEKFLKYCGPDRHRVLFLDQHHSHEALGMLELARKERIEITAFPPHASN